MECRGLERGFNGLSGLSRISYGFTKLGRVQVNARDWNADLTDWADSIRLHKIGGSTGKAGPGAPVQLNAGDRRADKRKSRRAVIPLAKRP
jgi:hypothetical protein